MTKHQFPISNMTAINQGCKNLILVQPYRSSIYINIKQYFLARFRYYYLLKIFTLYNRYK
ncbi:hypothetical protein FDUTEX481_00610 [Tolypothrix sp. PCC 7601]|nr:hypothetical protein FDUTEX481_00610 [Tolypothrix sp. PCC 7601]